jgi:hypothetical protein
LAGAAPAAFAARTVNRIGLAARIMRRDDTTSSAA